MHASVKKRLEIDPEKVLKWLQENNPLYRHITINRDADTVEKLKKTTDDLVNDALSISNEKVVLSEQISTSAHMVG